MQISSRKSSCGDLQSRLKVRKVLGVGETTGSMCSSKISQILGQSDHLLFQLPPKLATWLVLSTVSFSCLSAMGFFWPACLRLLLPGDYESTLHLATSYAFLAIILGLTLRSGNKTSLQLVLLSLTLFHLLSFLIALWLFSSSKTKFKALLAGVVHSSCLCINTHFYRSINRTVLSSFRYNKLKAYLNSIMSFPSSSHAVENGPGHDSS